MTNDFKNEYFEKECNVSYYDFKILIDHYRNNYGDKGMSIFYSILSIENMHIMDNVHEKIDEELHEKFDPISAKIDVYIEKCNELKRAYVDRDAQGNPLKDEHGEPIITEMKIEYDEATAKLNEEYKDAYMFNMNFQNNINEYLKQRFVKLVLFVPNTITKLPAELPPAIVEIYYKLLAD